MNKISIFRALIKNTVPSVNVSLADVFKVLRSEKYKNVTAELRSKTNKVERDLWKQNKLDYATSSGTFTKRANAGLIQHSNYFCVDMDHVGDKDAIEAMKQRVLKVYKPALMFVSPSGDGLKIVYQIDTGQASHEQFFSAFQTFFRNEFNIEIDEKCKDVSRACFLCYDPECFMSEAPTIMDKAFINTFSPTQPRNETPGAIINQQPIIEKWYWWTLAVIHLWGVEWWYLGNNEKSGYKKSNRKGLEKG